MVTAIQFTSNESPDEIDRPRDRVACRMPNGPKSSKDRAGCTGYNNTRRRLLKITLYAYHERDGPLLARICRGR